MRQQSSYHPLSCHISLSPIGSLIVRTLPSGISVLATLLALFITCAGSISAWACGGLFCDSTTPVNQAAERILFAPDPDGGIQMHVLIQYQGPPDDFSWLLPVPSGTSFGVSRPALFTQLDLSYQPTFRLNRVRPDYCSDNGPMPRAAVAFDSSASERNQEPAVQVTSQSQVGPYDQVTLQANDLDALTTWLTENGYQVPPNAEEALSPYLEGYEFLAIKLASGRESGDIQPVSLHLPTDTPTIPLRPTAVAAEDDMGVIVHILGSARAIPTNYQLVELNYAALDWFNPAQHYAELVAHAVDEAEGGRAFVTDFAGEHQFGIESVAPLIAENLVLSMDEVRDGETLYQVLSRLLTGVRQPDLNTVLLSALPLEREAAQALIDLAVAGVEIDSARVYQILGDGEGGWITVDGGAIARDLSAYNDGGVALRNAFGASPYLTRLYTTLNASEMSVDPSFAMNPDLSDVDRAHTATLFLNCDGDSTHIVTEDGLEVELPREGAREVIGRQDGETVRAQNTIGAAVIYRPMSAGLPEVVTDRRAELTSIYQRARPDSSAGCQQRDERSSSDAPLYLFTLLSILSLSSLVSSSMTRER